MNKNDIKVIKSICERLEDMTPGNAHEFGSRASRVMDLESIADELDIYGLARAKDGDFLHDVVGIHRHMDRSEYPGKLGGCFLPRYSKACQTA